MKIYEPVKPALASPSKNLEDLIKRTGFEQSGEIALEYKIDGFRCEAHCDSSIALYSRKLNKLNTEAYPDIVSGLKELGLENTVLDGELVAYNPETKELVSFQETMKRKRNEFNANSFPLKYIVFDVLMADGEETIDRPYQERRKILEGLKWNDTVELIEAECVSTKEQISEFYNKSLEKGFEGVMAKKIDSAYEIGKRNNNWVKLKPTITVDCIVMGWYNGNGCRETWAKEGPGIGAFLFGVYNPNTERYETLVKAGTGLNKEWAIELLEKVRKNECEEMPEEYVAAKEKKPDYWVSPEHVIELRGQQITKSPVHSSGYSLRFPTLLHLRQDKKASDSTTVSEIEEMFTG